jgi:hypothetical protein
VQPQLPALLSAGRAAVDIRELSSISVCGEAGSATVYIYKGKGTDTQFSRGTKIGATWSRAHTRAAVPQKPLARPSPPSQGVPCGKTPRRATHCA